MMHGPIHIKFGTIDRLIETESNKWQLVGIYSSVITMMHGPIHIKFKDIFLSFLDKYRGTEG